MLLRLTMVTSLIALFALSFSAIVDTAHRRSAVPPAGENCLADGLLCTPGGDVRG